MRNLFKNLFAITSQVAPEDPTALSKALFRLIENWEVAETQAENELMARVGDLISRGADVNYKNEEYSRSNSLRQGDLKVTTLPQIAAQKGFYKVLRGLLQEGANADGLLGEAIRGGDAKMIKVLAEEGVNFQENIQGRSPLLYAALFFSEVYLSESIREEGEVLTEVSKALIAGGSEMRPEENILAVVASHLVFSGVAKLLIKKSGPEFATEALLVAAECHNPEIVKFALANGASPKGREGRDSPLHLVATWAFSLESEEIIETLMRANASLGKEDQVGRNVLRKAKERGSESIFNHIVSLSAMLQVQSPENWEVVKQALANPDYKNFLNPQNKKMLSVCSLGEEEILEESESLKKFSEMKQVFLSQFKSAGQSNPMGLANAAVAELIVNPQKLKEVANLRTVVVSPQPRSTSEKGAEKYSILGNKFSSDVLSRISSFIGLSSYLPEGARDVAANSLRIFFNPKSLPESEGPSSSAAAFDSSRLAGGKEKSSQI